MTGNCIKIVAQPCIGAEGYIIFSQKVDAILPFFMIFVLNQVHMLYYENSGNLRIQVRLVTEKFTTYQESDLHSALKMAYVTTDLDRVEYSVDDYVIDVVHPDEIRGDELIEIQTGNFSHIKKKFAALLPHYRMRLVYPIAIQRWLVNLNADGTQQVSRRKSPKKGRVEQVFSQLIYLRDVVNHQNFSLDVALIHDEEIRLDDGKGSWRRKGRSISNRRLLSILEIQHFEHVSEFSYLLPADLPEQFTTLDLRKALKINARLAGKMVYCLTHFDVIERTGKQGRAYLYRRKVIHT